MKQKIMWKWVLGISVLLLIFLMILLPQSTKYVNISLGERGLPDTLLLYTGSDLYDIAGSYGEEGRKAFVQFIWTFDLVWPFVYTLFLVLWIYKLLEYSKENKWLKYLFLFPLSSMLLDFFENIGTTIVVVRYPLRSEVIASITPFMTLGKWITVMGSILIVMALIILVVFCTIKSLCKKRV